MVSTLVICIMFSAGMPALYIVGFFFFTSAYFVNKVGLISFYLKSTQMSNALSSASKIIFFLSLPLHIIFGLFMLTDPSLLFLKKKPDWDFQIFDFESESKKTGARARIAQRNFFQKRVFYGYQQLYLLFFIIYMGIFILWKTAGDIAFKSLSIFNKQVSSFCIWLNYTCFVKSGRKQRFVERYPNCYICLIVFCCCNRAPKIKKGFKASEVQPQK